MFTFNKDSFISCLKQKYTKIIEKLDKQNLTKSKLKFIDSLLSATYDSLTDKKTCSVIEWVSTLDKLPAKNIKVLIACKLANGLTTTYTGYIDDSGSWILKDKKYENIIAWSYFPNYT